MSIRDRASPIPEPVRFVVKNGTNISRATSAGIHLYAQEKQPPRWTVEACIDYAVDHNHRVRQQLYAQKSMQSQHIRAIGNFLPYISAGTSIQNSYGRAGNKNCDRA